MAQAVSVLFPLIRKVLARPEFLQKTFLHSSLARTTSRSLAVEGGWEGRKRIVLIVRDQQ